MIDEHRLWLAVLVRAINDLTSTDGYERASHLRYFTRLWFVSSNHDVGSFLWICDHLDFDASWLRRRLFQIVDTPVLKYGHFRERGPYRPRKNPRKSNTVIHLSESPAQTASAIAPGLTISPLP